MFSKFTLTFYATYIIESEFNHIHVDRSMNVELAHITRHFSERYVDIHRTSTCDKCVAGDLLLMITSCLYGCVVGSASVCLSVRCE